MAAIPINDKEYELGENAIDRVRALDDIKLTGSMLPVEDEGIPGKLIVDYKGEEYEFFYFYSDFELHEMYFHQAQFFSEDEMYEMKNIKKALIGYMKFGVNVRKSYILQLKLLKTLMPEVLAFQDESAEKILNRRWVELTLSSLTVCEMNALYSVQMVQNNENTLKDSGISGFGIFSPLTIAS